MIALDDNKNNTGITKRVKFFYQRQLFFFLMKNIIMLIVILVFSLPGLEPGLLTPLIT